MDFQIERRVLVKYTGNGGDVVIPEGVKKIGDKVFYNCDSLTSVTIPEGVKSIGNWAFWGCSSLEEVYYTGSLASWVSMDKGEWNSTPLSNGAVLYCDGEAIRELVIPEGMKSIGNRAFWNCSSLTSVTIPESVTSIGDSAFSGCSSLTSVTIPESVTSIGDGAFSGCSSLTGVTIPEGVMSIGGDAFFGCSSLTSVTIPEGVTSIGECAFEGCGSLTGVTIPKGATIGEEAFSTCGLTSVTIPEGAIIREKVFCECHDLMSVTIRAGASIGESAFHERSSLTSVTIPEGKIYIEPCVFDACSVKELYFTGNLASWVSLDKYWGDTPLNYGAVLYCNGEPIQNDLVIPEGVTSIGYMAFWGCSSLTSVIIPEGVTSIGEYAFDGCTGLISVTIPKSVTSIEKNAFKWCKSLKKILIPNISLLPKELQPIACISIVTGKGMEPESDLFKAGIAYIKKQRARPDFIDIAIRTPELLAFMCREKLITAAGFDQYWEASEKLDDPAVKAALLDYRQNGLGTKKLEGARGARQKKQDKDEDIIITKAMRRANAQSIQGLVFAITGALETFENRAEAKAEIEQLGGKLASGVTANVDYLVTNDTDSGSEKNQRAASLGIEVINEKDFNHLICRRFKDQAEVVIPSWVTKINNNAFYNCRSMTSVTIPDSVTEIGRSAFEGCTNLTSVTMPDSVTKIGSSAFYGCTGLTSVTIPDSVTEIWFLLSIGVQI